MEIGSTDAMNILRIIAALVLLLITCRSDWKTRTAEDWVWMTMGIMGIVLLGIHMYIGEWEVSSLAGLVLICFAFLDIFWDRKPLYDGQKKKANVLAIVFLVIGIILLIYMIITPMELEHKLILLGVVGMVYLMHLFYIVNLIHGGADAKALMVLAMLFPFYPTVFSLPLFTSSMEVEIIPPFTFLILLYAGLSALTVPIALLFYNISKKDVKIPQALLGYKKDISSGDPPFAWPMQYVDGDEIRFKYFPKKGTNSKELFNQLREKGITETWVTPKIPFLIPITAGFVLAVILGNILWLVF